MQVSKRSSLVVLAAGGLLVLMAAALPVYAQADLVSTYLEVQENPPVGEGETWTGSAVTAQLDVELCSDEPGGANAAGGSVVVTATASGPGWVSIEVSDPIELTPPMGPEPEAPGCGLDGGSFNIQISTEDLQYSSSVDIDVSLEVGGAEGEEEDIPVPANGMGTYMAPEGTSTGFRLMTIEAPSDGDDDEGSGGQPDTQESPAAPFLSLVVLGSIFWAAWLRNRR